MRNACINRPVTDVRLIGQRCNYRSTERNYRLSMGIFTLLLLICLCSNKHGDCCTKTSNINENEAYQFKFSVDDQIRLDKNRKYHIILSERGISLRRQHNVHAVLPRNDGYIGLQLTEWEYSIVSILILMYTCYMCMQ